MSFKQQLIKLNVCQDAIDWVEDRTIQQAWNDCRRGNWMLWLLEEMKEEEGWLDEKEIMLLGCWCSRRALKYMPEGETRSLKAIEAKEAWARGEITREEMVAARPAAWAAINDARDANAVSATTSAASAAASAAAWAAAWATAKTVTWAAACTAAWDASWVEEASIQADYIRTQFTPPV